MTTRNLLARLEVLYLTIPSILNCELRENSLVNFGFQSMVEFALVLAASLEYLNETTQNPKVGFKSTVTACYRLCKTIAGECVTTRRLRYLSGIVIFKKALSAVYSAQ